MKWVVIFQDLFITFLWIGAMFPFLHSEENKLILRVTLKISSRGL